MPVRDRSKRLNKYQEDFKRHWFAAFRNTSARVGSLSPGELRLAMRILDASLLKGRFAIRIGNGQLAEAVALSRSKLYAARSALVSLHIIAATKDGEEHWVYELLNPTTRKSFPGAAGVDEAVTIEEEWGNKFTI